MGGSGSKKLEVQFMLNELYFRTQDWVLKLGGELSLVWTVEIWWESDDTYQHFYWLCL